MSSQKNGSNKSFQSFKMVTATLCIIDYQNDSLVQIAVIYLNTNSRMLRESQATRILSCFLYLSSFLLNISRFLQYKLVLCYGYSIQHIL